MSAAALTEAAMMAGVAATLCLTTRAFGIHNLSAGVWVTIGGWLLTTLHPSSFADSPKGIWLLALVVIAQAAAPLVMRDALRDQPLLYLFVTLGTALIVVEAARSVVLSSHAAIIPLQVSPMAIAFLIAGLVGLVVGLVFLIRTRRVARAILLFRSGDKDGAVWRGVAALILIEQILLLLWGAATYFVHKGLVGTAETITVVALLAVVVAGGRPIVASTLAFTVVAAAHGTHAVLPKLPDIALPLAIALLLIPATIRSLPRHPVLLARSAEVRDRLRGAQVLAALAIWIVLTAVALMLHGPTAYVVEGVLISLLTLVGWVAHRYTGVLTITWPAIGVLIVYAIITVHLPWPALIACAIAYVAVWTCYLLTLRLLRTDIAMVVDIGLLLTIYSIVKASTLLVGPDEIRYFLVASSSTARVVALSGVITTVCLLIGGAWLTDWSGWSRSVILSATNIRFASLHGYSAVAVFFTVLFSLVIVTPFGVGLFHVAKPSVTPGELALLPGLQILLFVLISETRLGVVVGIGSAMALTAILLPLFAFLGAKVAIIIGVAFLTIGLISRTLRHANAT